LDLTVNAEAEPSLPRQERLDARRLRILDAITGVYRVVLPVFVALGLLAWLVVGVFALRLHDVRTFWLTCSTALVGFGTRMLLLAIVSAVAFPSMNVLYVSPAPPLLLLFCALALMSAYRVAELWRMPDRLDAAETTSHPEGGDERRNGARRQVESVQDMTPRLDIDATKVPSRRMSGDGGRVRRLGGGLRRGAASRDGALG
jgi:hypothetical protein